VLSWGRWFQTICFDHEKGHLYLRKFWKNYEMTKKEQFKGPLKTTYRNETFNGGETRDFSPSESPHSKQ
jgi:hypothetical protein